jgi:hypothetical protein
MSNSGNNEKLPFVCALSVDSFKIVDEVVLLLVRVQLEICSLSFNCSIADSVSDGKIV